MRKDAAPEGERPLVGTHYSPGVAVLESAASEDRTKPGLTGLRGLAVLAVFVVHTRLPPSVVEAHPLLVKLKEMGWIAVPVFFVLSGYLITWLALEERDRFGTLNLRYFYARRALRIFPVYYLVVFVALALWLIPYARSLAASPAWGGPLLTFTTNFFLVAGMKGVPVAYVPLWTLAAEEQFYLFWGATLRFARLPLLGFAALCAIVISLYFRIEPGGYSYFLLYRMHPGVSLGSIMAGCVLAIAEPHLRRATGDFDLSWIVIGGLVAIWLLNWPQPVTVEGAAWLVSIVDVVSVLIVFECARAGSLLTRWASSRAFLYMGKISYPFYLVHFAVIDGYVRLKGKSGNFFPDAAHSPYVSIFVDVVLTFGVAVLAGELLTRLERPFKVIRKRLSPVRSGSTRGLGKAPHVVTLQGLGTGGRVV